MRSRAYSSALCEMVAILMTTLALALTPQLLRRPIEMGRSPHRWCRLYGRPRMSLGQPPPDEAETEAVKRTLDWLDGFIIQHQICPFAAPVRRHTRVVVCHADDATSCLRRELDLLREVDASSPATTLVVTPWLSEFADLMDLQERVEAMASSDEAAPIVQVLAFHPRAAFEHPHDAADFSMRSPLPMLHLLRDDDVVEAERQWAQQHAPGPVPGIQERNAALLRGMGYDKVAELVRQCERPRSGAM